MRRHGRPHALNAIAEHDDCVIQPHLRVHDAPARRIGEAAEFFRAKNFDKKLNGGRSVGDDEIWRNGIVGGRLKGLAHDFVGLMMFWAAALRALFKTRFFAEDR